MSNSRMIGKPWAASAVSLMLFSSVSSGQNFTMQVTDPDPLGIGAFIPDALPGADLGLGEGIKGDFYYNLRTEGEYNSNFFLEDSDEEDEFSIRINPTIEYNSDPEGGAPVTFRANYSPTHQAFFENSDLSTFNNAGNATLTFEGSRTLLSFFGRYTEESGSDRLTGDFIDGSVFTGGVRLARQIAARTTINASWTGALSEFEGSVNEGSEVYTTSVGGLWQATERIQLGPTLRYSVRESDNIGSTDAWAFLMDARYRVGERIFLTASLGPEFSNDSGPDGDDISVMLTGDFSARYMINERLFWITSFRSASVPAPTETNYLVNDMRFTTSVQRQLTRGFISSGFELDFSDFEDVGTVTTNRGDETTLSWFVNYRRPVFSDRVALDATLRYRTNSGQVDWDQWLLTSALNVVF